MAIIVESGPWKLDRARSSATFKHKTVWGLMTVKGRFASIAGRGEVLADRTARGTLTIDVASLDTKHTKRDEHLRSDDLFNTERYPLIIFTARTAPPQPNDTKFHRATGAILPKAKPVGSESGAVAVGRARDPLEDGR